MFKFCKQFLIWQFFTSSISLITVLMNSGTRVALASETSPETQTPKTSELVVQNIASHGVEESHPVQLRKLLVESSRGREGAGGEKLLFNNSLSSPTDPNRIVSVKTTADLASSSDSTSASDLVEPSLNSSTDSIDANSITLEPSIEFIKESTFKLSSEKLFDVSTSDDGDDVSNLTLSEADQIPSSYKVASEQIQAEPGQYKPSRALNLLVLRAFKKPTGKKVLDTGVSIAGIRPRDTSENFWTRDFLTGNWGGLRDELYKNGIDITLAQFIEGYANIDGGKERASAYNGVSIISFDFYTGGLKLWQGGQVHLTTAWLDGGTSVGRNFVGALNSVYFSDPPTRNFRLFELWYGQKFLDNKLEVRLGKIYPFVKNAASQPSSIFTNTSFHYPTFLGTAPSYGVANAYATAPFGVQILYEPTKQFFIYSNFADGFDDPTGGYDNRYGMKVGLSEKEGMEGIVEVGYKLNQAKGSTGLPGVYRGGVQFHTGEFYDNQRNTNGTSRAFNGTPKTHRGNYGFYLMAEQMLWRESPDPKDRTQGLTGFLKATFTPPENINTISMNLAGGLVYEGPIPGRDRDVVGIGVTYSQIGDGLRQLDRDRLQLGQTSVVRDGETVIELLYAAEIAPWWVLVGSLQKIIHPSGYSTTPDATVIGISSRFAF
jgi:porin